VFLELELGILSWLGAASDARLDPEKSHSATSDQLRAGLGYAERTAESP
jgi:hypothetical protein